MPDLNEINNKIENTLSELEAMRKRVNSRDEQINRLESELEAEKRSLEEAEVRLKERDTIREAYIEGTKVSDTAATGGTTVAHKLGRTPKMVFITPKGDGNAYLTNTSASSITVKGTVDFDAYIII